jgi:hypothetical protein
MESIWLITCEILVEPGDLASGQTKAFANVVTWADSQDSVTSKIKRYLESFKWHLISFENAHPVDDGRAYSEEVWDLIDRARTNPQAIILGTFFSYKED